ncbi:MAG TPA: hypothetical protein VFL97_06015 [Nitrococcus sp.]|nr:hypothetical protein [Nitrococcus sp.]
MLLEQIIVAFAGNSMELLRAVRDRLPDKDGDTPCGPLRLAPRQGTTG